MFYISVSVMSFFFKALWSELKSLFQPATLPAGQLLLFLRFIAVFLLVLTGFRLAFMLIFYPAEASFSYTELLSAFLIGLRFDIATALITLAVPFLLMMLMPVRSRLVHKLIGIIVYSTLFLLLMFSISDIFYYAKSNKKIGFEIVITLQNFGDLAYLALTSYWYAFILLGALFYATYLLWQKYILSYITDLVKGRRNFSQRMAILILALILLPIGIRGGLQSRPLKPVMAFQNDNMFLGYLALNGYYSALTALYKKDTLPVHNSEIDEIAPVVREIVGAEHERFLNDDFIFYRETRESSEQKDYNVVILIMESWGYSDTGVGGQQLNTTPYFDSLVRKSLLYTRHYTTSQRTIPVLPAVVSSIPTLFGQVYTTSSYQQNRQRGIATILKEKGYRSILAYAAKPGSMGISTYAPIAGFENLITRDSFDLDKVGHDGVWGVYDEYTFKKLHEEFEKSDKPFIAFMKTIHPHPPFTTPDNKDYFNGKGTPFLNDMRYTDECLRDFMQMAQESDYYDNTLFVILGDHSFGRKKGMQIFHTPLLFHAPGLIKPGRSDRLASNLDILPTILDLLNIETTHSSMGKSLLPAADTEERIIVDLDNIVGYGNSDFILMSSTQKPIGLYNHRRDHLLENNLLGSNSTEAIKQKNRLKKEWDAYLSAISLSIMNDKIAPVQ